MPRFISWNKEKSDKTDELEEIYHESWMCSKRSGAEQPSFSQSALVKKKSYDNLRRKEKCAAIDATLLRNRLTAAMVSEAGETSVPRPKFNLKNQSSIKTKTRESCVKPPDGNIKQRSMRNEIHPAMPSIPEPYVLSPGQRKIKPERIRFRKVDTPRPQLSPIPNERLTNCESNFVSTGFRKGNTPLPKLTKKAQSSIKRDINTAISELHNMNISRPDSNVGSQRTMRGKIPSSGARRPAFDDLRHDYIIKNNRLIRRDINTENPGTRKSNLKSPKLTKTKQQGLIRQKINVEDPEYTSKKQHSITGRMHSADHNITKIYNPLANSKVYKQRSMLSEMHSVCVNNTGSLSTRTYMPLLTQRRKVDDRKSVSNSDKVAHLENTLKHKRFMKREIQSERSFVDEAYALHAGKPIIAKQRLLKRDVFDDSMSIPKLFTKTNLRDSKHERKPTLPERHVSGSGLKKRM